MLGAALPPSWAGSMRAGREGGSGAPLRGPVWAQSSQGGMLGALDKVWGAAEDTPVGLVYMSESDMGVSVSVCAGGQLCAGMWGNLGMWPLGLLCVLFLLGGTGTLLVFMWEVPPALSLPYSGHSPCHPFT